MTYQSTSRDKHTLKTPLNQSTQGTTSIPQRRNMLRLNSSAQQKENIIGQLSIGAAQATTGIQPQKLLSEEIAHLLVGGKSRIPNTHSILPQSIPQ